MQAQIAFSAVALAALLATAAIAQADLVPLVAPVFQVDVGSQGQPGVAGVNNCAA